MFARYEPSSALKQAVDVLLDWYAEGGWNDVDRELTDAIARVTL